MLNVSSGQTNGMTIVATTKKPSTVTEVSYYINDGQGGLTMINDVDPGYDVCSKPSDQAMMSGQNIGDLLNKDGITWGSFMGGFRLDVTNANGTTGCKRSTHSTVVGADVVGLHPAPRLVPVLRVNRQCEARTAECAAGHRLQPRT